MPQAAVAEAPSAVRSSSAMSKSKPPARATAETMAARQRDISVSEFFAKNRHLLGFDNPRKALLTTVKEAVDNSLDACEEAGILPDITVVIEDLQPDRGREVKQSRYRITVVDNGPGIVRRQVEHIFGRLLYGSKFHRLKMSRGQQGIGISAAGMYGLITTGKPMFIQTRPSANRPAHHIELAMNTKTNRAEVTTDEETEDFPLARLRDLTPGTRELSAKGAFLSASDYPTGTSVSIELEGRYQKGRGSVDEFLELTAIANPHARITFVPPSKASEEEEDIPLLKAKGAPPEQGAPGASPAPPPPVVTTETGGVVVYPRAVSDLPPETKEIQPHPKGIELGTLLQMVKDYEGSGEGGTLYSFLQDRFCRVSAATASAFCEKIGVTSRTRIVSIEPPQVEKLFKEFQEAKLAPPPTDCLAPIGVRQMLAGMLKGVRAEFYAASTRDPAVYRGRPFQLETAIAFGGDLPADEPARVIRFANRVPLLFQQSACSSFKAVVETGWRNYNLQQPRGSLPVGPLIIMIHMASVWVPFTSESKEAIADYDEIRKEMKLALMECGRKLGTYLRKRQAMRREGERRDVFERYIGEIAKAVSAINGADSKKLYDALLAQARERTAIADTVLDEDGKAVKEDPAEQEGVIIVEPVLGTGSGIALSQAVGSDKGGKSAPKPAADGSIFEQSAVEKAMLAVAARAKDDTKLLDTDPPGRSSRSGKSPRPQVPKNVKAAAGKPAAPVKSASSVPAPAPAAKPKMRLVNGKLVPVDEPGGLF
ncbi:MAG: DNA topoisomerase VI subunit B [Phycisphaerae bacterium]|nr:DNA topoisomerase VI subunit B [Phycisphaerae bacterium]